MSSRSLSREERKSMKRQCGNDVKNNSDWPNCMFWIKNRNRYCSFKRSPNSLYCANHYLEDQNNEVDNNPKRRRVPCPLDPSHSVYEDCLKKHMSICNKAKSQEALKHDDYFQCNLNTQGDILKDDYKVYQNNNKATEENLTELNMNIHQYALLFIERINSTYSKVFPNSIPLKETIPEEVKSYINEKKDQECGHDKLRHIYQQGSMIQIMKDLDIFMDNTIFVEMGAGRGMLTYMIEYIKHNLNHTNDAKYILVDCGKNRFKCDRQMRHKGQDAFQRININIKDLNINGISMIHNSTTEPVVYISKHLCGVATDYTLKSLTSRISGVCIATCCHHRCIWNDYVGKQTYINLGYKPFEFEVMKKMSSWTCCSDSGLPKTKNLENTYSNHNSNNLEKSESDSISHSEDNISTLDEKTQEFTYMNLFYELKNLCLTDEDYRELGRKCKRIIDYGRQEYINSLNFKSSQNPELTLKASLAYYCKVDESPENCLLLASYK